MTTDILFEIAKIAPSIGILAYFLMYFQKQIAAKDEEIKELNSILREQQKDAINTMTKLTTVIEDLKDLIKQMLNKQ